MRLILKKLFKSKPMFFKVWFYLDKDYLSKNIRLPKKEDDFYFEGYPRSGNTYVYNLIKELYPESKSCSHLHSIAGLKIAKAMGVPAIVIVRNPDDAIASNLYRKMIEKHKDFENEILTEIIEDWIDFYSYVLKTKQKLHIIVFDKFLNDKYEGLNSITEFLNKDSLDFKTFEEIFQKFDYKMKLKESSKETASSSLPSEERKKYRMKKMEEIRNHPNFHIAKNIYNEF